METRQTDAARGRLTLRVMQADSPAIDTLERINRESFPENELVPVRAFFEMTELTLDVLGIFLDETPVGFLILMRQGTSAYINYFAIDEALRGRGIGSRALALLDDICPGVQVTVDFESVEEACGNPAQRKRRRDFYLRSGFRSAGLYMYYMETEFEVAYRSEREFDRAGFAALMAALKAAAPSFRPRIYEKNGRKDK